MNDAAEPPDRVDLARESDFTIGELLVEPFHLPRSHRQQGRACRAAGDGGHRGACARQGRTVSRDRLVEACWEGRIVSDDAINRVVAKARQLARRIDPPAFSIETTPKVGYRLLANLADAGASAEGLGDARAEQADLCAGRLAEMARASGPLARTRPGGSRTCYPCGGVGGRGDAVRRRLSAARSERAGGSDVVRACAARGPGVAEPFDFARSRGGACADRKRSEDACRGRPASTPARAERTPSSEWPERCTGPPKRSWSTPRYSSARSGMVLWSTQLERPIDLVVGLDEQAANDIAGALYCALGEREAAGGRMNVEVLSLFLNACAAAIQMQNPEQMLSVTRRLIEAAPNLAGAHAMHALALTSTAMTGMRNTRDEATRLIADARASATQALRLNPREAKAYVGLSDTYYYAPNAPNWVEMERNLRRALEIDPELTYARLAYAHTLRHVGRSRAALDAFSGLTRAADPRARSNLLLVGILQAQLGNRGAADAMADRLARIYPSEARELEWALTFWWDDAGVARSKLPSLVRGSALREQQVVCFDKYLSGLARRENGATRGLPNECSAISADWRIRMLARQGDIDAAYALFETTRTQSAAQLAWLLYYPQMREFRRDRRFMPLAKKVGLVDYWLTTDKWPDFCSEPDLPYDCRAAARAA